MGNNSKYYKLKRIGYSISYKDFLSDFEGEVISGGGYADRKIGHILVCDLKGWWWCVPDERIYKDDFEKSKYRKINDILVIVDDRVYNETTPGRINVKSNIAYIKQDKFHNLF